MTGLSRINNSGQWVSTVIGNGTDGESVGRFVIAYDGVRLDPYGTIPFRDDLVIGATPNRARHTAINNHGQIATGISGFLFDPEGNYQGQGSMLAIDGGVVVRSGEPTPLGVNYPTQFGSSQFILNDQGHLLANFDLFPNPFSTFETVIEFSPSESGYDQTVRIAPGMPLQDGFNVRGDSPANWGSFDLSNSGNTVTGTFVANDDLIARPAIVVNGTIRRMSGPNDDYPDGNFNLSTRQVAINDSGEFAYSGIMASSDWDGGRWTVFRNEDEIIWIDDGSDPLLDNWNFSSVRSISVTDGGDVFWQPRLEDTTGETLSALFRNDVVIATSDPNFLGDALYIEGGFSFDISDNGQWIIFDTPGGIYRAMIPSPSAAAILALTALSTTRRRRKPEIGARGASPGYRASAFP
ncbi:MAG: hypothetical protein ACNA8P_10090, partial [Phycisphaerales bacterium]